MNNLEVNNLVPMVIEQSAHGDRAFDIFSKLLRSRIVFVTGEIHEYMANAIVAQLLLLESEDPKQEIKMYINSPGGSVTAGMAIYDTMQFIKPDVSTICIGQACSMGALLLAAGAHGKRKALKHSRIMFHQPSAGFYGQVTDIEIHSKEVLKMKRILNEIVASHTGQPAIKIKRDFERDNFMSPEEALKYGAIDHIVTKR